jgi:DNA-binding transcriptional MerR regulator
MPDDDHHSLTELADLAGVTPRTVRYYLAHGLLPASGQSGPGVRYGPGHLGRLRLIRRLQGEHLPLAEIRGRLDALRDDEILDLAGREAPAPPADSALDYLRSVLGDGAARPSPGSPGSPSPVPAPGLMKASAPPPLNAAVAEASPPYGVAIAERTQWERIVLGPDVELHIRRPLRRSQNKQVDRLVTIARELLGEDQP